MVHGRSGEEFEVCLWCPELPGVSFQCWESSFIRFSSVPGVSGMFYIWFAASGDLRFFLVTRSSVWSAGVGWSLDY